MRELAPSPWSVVAALSFTLATALATPEPTRVAIRVDGDHAELAEAIALDVWSERRGPGMPLDVVVASDALPYLAGAFEILDPDIDATARAEAARLRRPAALQPADWFAEYKDYRAITERLHQLAAAAPDRASVHGIGSTIDGRTIWALRIGRGETSMLLDGTQHAREWITSMATTCIADRLVNEYERDPAIRALVDTTELWIVPVVNPDGYQHTWASNRYWRKNRRGGYGVDLNRNWSVAWGERGASKSKMSDVYRGERPFSEPETAALRDLAKREDIDLHIDFHSYGQILLFPWTWTATPTKDHARYGALGDRLASAMFATHQQRYTLTQGIEFYPASGTMTDFMYGEVDALSFTIELRPPWGGGRGRGGFVLPPEQIRPTCDEALASVLALRTAR